MAYGSIITPKAAIGHVTRQLNLGVDSYDLDELWSPDSEIWQAKVLDLSLPKYLPQVATAPTRYWFDRSRYNNHGTIIGATWKQLPSGDWVMSFDAVDDYITIPHNAAFNITEAITILYWIKFNSIDEVSDHYILTKGANKWMSQIQTTKKFRWYADVPAFDINSTTVCTTGVWYFVALTYDRITARLYVNAVQEASVAKTAALGTDANNLVIGNYIDLAQAPFGGVLGKLVVYNRAFSLAEIQQKDLVTKMR